jgi:hypothetical protein
MILPVLRMKKKEVSRLPLVVAPRLETVQYRLLDQQPGKDLMTLTTVRERRSGVYSYAV